MAVTHNESTAAEKWRKPIFYIQTILTVTMVIESILLLIYGFDDTLHYLLITLCFLSAGIKSYFSREGKGSLILWFILTAIFFLILLKKL